MEFKEYIGCIICGIPQEKALTTKCRLDAVINNIKLIDSPYISIHHWTIIKQIHDWYGGKII